MRKSAVISLLAIALLLIPAMPSYAWRGHPSVFIGVGPGWWGPAYPYWYYPPPYYVYSPPPVVVQEPAVQAQGVGLLVAVEHCGAVRPFSLIADSIQ